MKMGFLFCMTCNLFLGNIIIRGIKLPSLPFVYGGSTNCSSALIRRPNSDTLKNTNPDTKSPPLILGAPATLQPVHPYSPLPSIHCQIRTNITPPSPPSTSPNCPMAMLGMNPHSVADKVHDASSLLSIPALHSFPIPGSLANTLTAAMHHAVPGPTLLTDTTAVATMSPSLLETVERRQSITILSLTQHLQLLSAWLCMLWIC
jgi:hypothetical protein